MISNADVNPCSEISLTPIDNPHNFKVGDLVIMISPSYFKGQIAKLDSIRNEIIHFSINGKSNYNVGSLSIFRPLTKLDKALK